MKEQKRWTTFTLLFAVLVLVNISCGADDLLENTGTEIPSESADADPTKALPTVEPTQPLINIEQESVAVTETPLAGDASEEDLLVQEKVSINTNTAFILDASGSMLADMGGRNRLSVAQDAVADLSESLPSSINASLWVYGHRVEKDNQTESCKDIEQVINLNAVDSQEFDRVAHSFAAKGYTPITDALRQAASSLPIGPHERNTIVLVSDGEETCGGDPCALAAELAVSDAKLVIYTIGLAADDITRTQLQCIAEVSGGTYTDANSAEDLSLALEEAAGSASDDSFSIVEGLGRPSVVVVSTDGKNVYVTGAGAESVVVFNRDLDTGRLIYLEKHVNGVDGVLGIESPYGLAISPDGKSVYATGGEDLDMAIFSRNPDSGALSFTKAIDVFGSVEGVDSAKAVVVSPDNLSVYVTGTDDSRTDGAIAVFSRDTEIGDLFLVEMLQDGVKGASGLRDLTGITVSPDNRSVYAVNVWHTMAVFDRDPNTSALSFVQLLEDDVDVINNGLLGVHVVVVSPDNQHVYVAGRRSDSLTVFDRNPDTGMLIFKDQFRKRVGDTLSNLDGAHGLAISPDGQNVYLASDNIDMLLGFDRDSQAGTLTLIDEFVDNIDGVDGLENGWSVALSPDGQNVYVAGFDDNSLAVFARDMTSGKLSFIEVIRNKMAQ